MKYINGSKCDEEIEDKFLVSVKKALQLWRKRSGNSMRQRHLGIIKAKKRRKVKEKEDDESLQSKLPVEIFVKEWGQFSEYSTDTVLYLIKQLIPTVVLGIEKVLLMAEKRNLIPESNPESDLREYDSNSSFNPINFLAQYLMRNNPNLSTFRQQSPYSKRLERLADDLDSKINKAAVLKHQAKLKRKKLEAEQLDQREEKKRRKKLIREQFNNWLLDDCNKLQLQLIQNGLFSFLEISMHSASVLEPVVQYSKELPVIDESGKSLTEDEYIEFLEDYLQDFSFKRLEDVLCHLDNCAAAFRKTFELEKWNQMFSELFHSLDTEDFGFIDRHRVLHLLEKFWDKMDQPSRQELRDPRQWPVIELEEFDDSLYETADSYTKGSNVDQESKKDNSEEWDDKVDLPGEEVQSFDLTETITGRPSSPSCPSVSFAPDAAPLDKPNQQFFAAYSSRSQSRMTSAFDESQLNKKRFITLLETFLDEGASSSIVEKLVNFIHDGYIETEEEKISRLARAHKEALSVKHRNKTEILFNKWDIDGQGYLDIDAVEEVLLKYKEGMEASVLKRGKQAVRQTRKHRFNDSRISNVEFHTYITAVCDAMTGGEEVFDAVTEFVATTVERTHTQNIRGEARRRWLQQIKSAAECSGASMDPVYRAVFQTLYKDADAHGNQKKLGAYIALLEKNNESEASHGDLCLRYVASTPDNAPYLLGEAMYEDMKSMSFYTVRRGKLVHIPRVRSHGHVYFWNPERLEDEKEGSLVMLPIKDDHNRVFGILGIDNLIDPADRSIFATHEINFYQGLTKTFASAFHHIDLWRKLIRIVDSAMSWIHSRAPHIVSITMYIVEPDPKSSSKNVLRKMLFADNTKGLTQIYQKPTRLYRKESLFRDYLFKCMESSETTTAEAYGEHHMAYPLRNEVGQCQCIIDVSLGKLKTLQKHEDQEMQRMLKLLQAANKEVLRESFGEKKNLILEAEQKASEEIRVDIMFDRLMLTDLRENVQKLDNNVFAELHNYKEPPTIIHNILKAVLMLFNQEAEIESFEDWTRCKQLATTRLKQQIVIFDPTASGAVKEKVVTDISKLLKGIAHGAVAYHGSKPAQQLYNWAFVCLSLIEHTKKVRNSSGQPTITPITSASTATTVDTQDFEIY